MKKVERVKRRKVEVFTLDGGQCRVKADVSGLSLKQAISLKGIISAFEASVARVNDVRTNVG
jgi:hypothetical protein